MSVCGCWSRRLSRRLAGLCVVAAMPLAAQAPGGRIVGIVADSARRPLDNASVTVVGTRYAAISDANGRFAITGVPAGTYTLRTQRIGNRAVETPNVSVSAGATTEMQLSLTKAALPLGGVVVSASRRVEKSTDAAATVTRLEAAQIANSFGNSYMPALKDVQGIDFIQVGITAVAINARGFNSSFNNRMLMLEDGRVAVLPESGLPVGGFTAIPTIDLAGVEVLVGSGSALYGPGASNGVLTLQSKDPRQFQGTTLEVASGSRGFMDLQARHAGVTSSGTIGYKISGEYLSANDFRNQLRYAGNVWEQGVGGSVDWKTDVLRTEGALVYYRGDRQFEFNAGGSKSNGVGQSTVGRNQFIDWQYRHAQLKWTSPSWYASAYATQSLSGDTYALDRYSSARVATPATISDDSIARLSDFPAEGRLYAVELRGNRTAASLLHTRLVYGVQLRRDDVSSRREWLIDRLTGENVIVNQQGIYAQSETPLTSQLRIVLSGRYDKSTAYDANFSPRAGVLYSPWNDHTLRVTYNQGYKTPTTPNTYFSMPDFVKLAIGSGGVGVYGNKDGFTVRNAAGATLATYRPLVSEKNTTYEVGYKGILGNRLAVDAAYYQSDYENFISPLVSINAHLTGTFAYDAAGQRIMSPNGAQSVLTYVNLGRARLHGADVGVRWVLTDHVAASGTLSLAKLGRVETKPTDAAAVLEATALNTTPTKWNVGMDFTVPERKLLGGFSVRHVTGYDFRSGINVGVIPTFETLDLALGRRIPALGAQLNVSLQNLVACSNGTYGLFEGQASPGTLKPKRGCNIGRRHLEMINMPTIGTMLFVGVRYDR